jgi:hypothetical protein
MLAHPPSIAPQRQLIRKHAIADMVGGSRCVSEHSESLSSHVASNIMAADQQRSRIPIPAAKRKPVQPASPNLALQSRIPRRQSDPRSKVFQLVTHFEAQKDCTPLTVRPNSRPTPPPKPSMEILKRYPSKLIAADPTSTPLATAKNEACKPPVFVDRSSSAPHKTDHYKTETIPIKPLPPLISTKSGRIKIETRRVGLAQIAQAHNGVLRSITSEH